MNQERASSKKTPKGPASGSLIGMSAVAFVDATYSVPKSITVVHAAFEAQEVRAGRDGSVPGDQDPVPRAAAG